MMFTSMIRSEIMKLYRRRVLFITGVVLCLLPPLFMMTSLFILKSRSELDVATAGGAPFLTTSTSGCFGVLYLMITILAAQAGAWDFSHGTYRFQLLSGQPHWRLILTRVPAVVIVAMFMVIPGILVGVVLSQVLPSLGNEAVNWKDLGDAFRSGAVLCSVAALLSFTIGLATRSSTVAVISALGTNLVGVPLIGLLTLLDERIIGYLLTTSIDVMAGASEETSVPFAFMVFSIWVLPMIIIGYLRVARSEY